MTATTLPMDDIDQILEAQKQPIEYLAFSGGGAKGVVYSGVQAALEDSGIMTGVKAVAGSSAGSITSAAIASGISKEKYEELAKNTNMKGLLGKEGLGFVNKDGKPLRELVATMVQSNVADYFQEINIEAAVTLRAE